MENLEIRDFNERCKSLNTAIESPFSNGIYERHKTVLKNIVLKVSYDENVNLNISLQWVINIKIVSSNVLGFWQFSNGYQIWKVYIIAALKLVGVQ